MTNSAVPLQYRRVRTARCCCFATSSLLWITTLQNMQLSWTQSSSNRCHYVLESQLLRQEGQKLNDACIRSSIHIIESYASERV